MEKTVVSIKISEKKVVLQKIIVNLLILILIIVSALLRGDTRLITVLILLFVLSFCIEVFIFYNYSFNKVEITDSQLLLSRGNKSKSIVFNEIKSINEEKSGIQIILFNKSKYRITGDIINNNDVNSDYSQKNIIVNEIDKISGLSIKYNKRKSWF